MHFFLILLLVLMYPLELYTLTFDTNDTNHSILKSKVITIKPECPNKCGDLWVPYPFGINSKDLNCSINPSFAITCKNSTNHPKAFIKESNIQVYDISNTELRIANFMAKRCYSQSGNDNQYAFINLGNTTYMYSAVNVFTVVGCDDYANIYKAPLGTLPKGCSTTCQNIDEVTHENEKCSGSGCCQVPIDVLNYFQVFLHTYNNHANVSSFNRCGYAFMGEKDRFSFQGKSDLIDPTFLNRTKETVPIVLDWVIGNESCTEAAQNSNSPICHSNSKCIDGTRQRGYRGYRCNCSEGYEGNPYLSPGCQDINECEQKKLHDCQQLCNNTDGRYNCYCRPGYSIDVSDVRKCIVKVSKSQMIKYALGIVFCCLFVIVGMNWVFCIKRKRRHSQLRENFFEQNGGLLLRQQSISEGGTVESTKHFTYEELKKATNNYSADRIVGEGGYGIVYKGILPDQRLVAVKRSKVLDTSQIDQFINEVVILAKVNHRNVVKLLGCCLECEVPMLVYEFVSNGTLFHHVHSIDGGLSWLSLDNRLRIAAESSGALAYLHSAASMPILHRDVKLANILLDDNCVSKISDFGASRLVPMDQTKVITLVQGTLGYLDPEYFHTGELTDKSDVYSFGVVLAELLTGRKPICMNNSMEEKNLATYFITSLKENRLFQILDRRVVREGAINQLEKAAQLVKRCLNLNGEERPTMKEVTMEIESLRKLSKHPWAEQHGNEDTISLKGHPEIHHSDLYEIQLSSYHNVVNDSEQYSSSIISLLHPPSSPR